MFLTDTIVAISSAPHPAARVIVRLSGQRAMPIACTLFAAEAVLEGGAATRQTLLISRMRVAGWVYFFKGPRSSTGEDLIELHLPGSPLIAARTLEALLAAGARAAGPGEFTARAFFNGKLDLAQAEGVAAMIAAQDADSLRAARALAAGELSRRVEPVVGGLTRTLALVEAGIDFVDEDITFLPAQELRAQIEAADEELARLLDGARRTDAGGNRPTVLLAGRPNAGKSTLLNALARADRAVVSDESGTTRDALETTLRLPGGLVSLLDSPGLEAEAALPAAGAGLEQLSRSVQRRARDEVARADFVVLVRDATDELPACELFRDPDLVVLSKSDLLAGASVDRAGLDGVLVCAQTGEGLADLIGRLDSLVFARHGSGTLALATRHVRALRDARAALAAAREQPPATPELAALELREALDALGSITGAVTPDDVLAQVFAAFCIGK